MGKKKFFDKKKSATFQLMARDTSDPSYSSEPSGDRVFVRTDNNHYTPDSFINKSDDFLDTERDSIFADAPEDCVDNDADYNKDGLLCHKNKNRPLPEHIKREILNLGLPNDGYNYLMYMKKIKNAGGGSAYYHNPQARADLLPRDIKAYDASRVEVAELNDSLAEKAIGIVASKTVGVRLQKALDPDVAAILDDFDSSKFGSDFEEWIVGKDFVIKVNHLDVALGEEIAGNDVFDIKAAHLPTGASKISGEEENEVCDSVSDSEKQRVRRPLDEQFDLVYDASRVEVVELNDSFREKAIGIVASKTVGVRLQKALDPDVAAILDDIDSSKFGANFEEWIVGKDFVIKGNHLDVALGEEIAGNGTSDMKAAHLPTGASKISGEEENEAYDSVSDSEKQRVRRPLDEQFDLLELHEYGSEGEEEYDECMGEFETRESLAEKLSHDFKSHPSELLQLNRGVDDTESPELTAAVIRRCKEYAEKYQDENHDEDAVLVEESSDESEVWDCETIVSTYSTLDNHPGKIGVPESRRKKKLSEVFSGTPLGSNHAITLKGKETLPLDFLPRREKHVEVKKKDDMKLNCNTTEVQKKPRNQVSKEEKKERKSALKLERCEARKTKKEIKGIYRSEAQLAQKVVAFTGPSSIHLK